LQEYLFKKEVRPGVVVHTIASGANLMMCKITLAKGAALPEHTHENEQASFVVSGRMRFCVNGEERVVSEGMGTMFASAEPHSALAEADSVLVEVFSPPREDYKGE